MIGVFGGSGFYSWLEGAETRQVTTPYGPPSAPVVVGEVAGRSVAFLPRHGSRHDLAAHTINYRANLWAFRDLGVTRVISPNAAGSLQPHVRPGDVVVCDQLVDRTSGRVHTFYDGPQPIHIAFADPFCAELRPIAAKAAREAGMNVHDEGTVVVVQGPRFSTRAESAWYRSAGWEVVNMTQYPEAALARELEMCYVSLSLITDYDVGVPGGSGGERSESPIHRQGRGHDDSGGPPEQKGDADSDPVTMEEVFRVFAANLDKLRAALVTMIERIPDERGCICKDALKGTPLRP